MSEGINRQSSVGDVSCVTAEYQDKLFHRTAPAVAQAVFMIVSTWQGNVTACLFEVAKNVRSDHITSLT